MKLKMILVTLMLGILFTGCFESIKNKASRDGGFFASSKGDYIIINSSGNIILDVYKLKNRFVSNQDGSDGVGFIDNDGNYVLLQGDCKVIRVTDSGTWNNYKEYHYVLDHFEYE